MVHDDESHAAEDKRRKEEVEERNLADSAAYRSEKSIADLGDKITPEQKSDLESKIADVRAALSTDDVTRIKASRQALEQAFYKVTESVYRSGAAEATDGANPNFGGGIDQEVFTTTPSRVNTKKCKQRPFRVLFNRRVP